MTKLASIRYVLEMPSKARKSAPSCSAAASKQRNAFW